MAGSFRSGAANSLAPSGCVIRSVETLRGASAVPAGVSGFAAGAAAAGARPRCRRVAGRPGSSASAPRNSDAGIAPNSALPGTTPAQVLLISVAQAVRTSPNGAAAAPARPWAPALVRRRALCLLRRRLRAFFAGAGCAGWAGRAAGAGVRRRLWRALLLVAGRTGRTAPVAPFAVSITPAMPMAQQNDPVLKSTRSPSLLVSRWPLRSGRRWRRRIVGRKPPRQPGGEGQLAHLSGPANHHISTLSDRGGLA